MEKRHEEDIVNRQSVLKGFLVIFAFILAFQTSISRDTIPLKTVIAHADISCTICTWLNEEVEKFITTQSTAEEVISAYQHVRAILPKDFQGMCSHFIYQYGHEMTRLLLNENKELYELCLILRICDY